MPMPNMATTVSYWQIPLTLQKTIQNIVNGDLVVTKKTYQFKGVIQPLSDEKLQFKPEGQRSWTYYWVHTNSKLNFQTADKIIYKNERYKITAIKNYELYGYKELEIIKDYESST